MKALLGGMARHKRGKYVEAIEDFKKVIELQPSNKELKKLMKVPRKCTKKWVLYLAVKLWSKWV